MTSPVAAHDDAPWHAQSAGAALERLASTAEGLSRNEAELRLARYGANRLRRAEPVSGWSILLDQFRSLVVLLLVGAALVALLMGDRLEALAIVVVLAINAAIGFVVELRARRTMDALLHYESSVARVRRAGVVELVPAHQLVPGDVIELEEGDSVPADGRLLATSGLRADEAPLTGESLPIDKEPDVVLEADAPLGDRRTMVYSGTTLVGGRGVAVVTGTGVTSEIGRIGELIASVEAGTTPLEARLDALGRRLVGLTLGVAALVTGLGVARGQELGLMIETGVALAIAAVPEGLPAVATIALAVGLRRMARRNALVRRLAAVEALGSTTVVCTDKTGTLTAGEMTVTRLGNPDHDIHVTGRGFETEGAFVEAERPVDPAGYAWLAGLLEASAHTSRAELAKRGNPPIGDPTDAALLVLAAKAGLSRDDLARRKPRVSETPFDTTLRLSASVHAAGAEQLEVHVKGAPTALFSRCTRWLGDSGATELDADALERLNARNDAMAADGLRVIALAMGEGEGLDGLTLLGLVGIVDPPAGGVADTIARLRGAGIRTVVVTGDQRATAEAVARSLGAIAPEARSIDGREVASLSDAELEASIGDVGVLSRVSPEDKLRIVAALQARGEVVAMIGDGVNDAAALKKADVGVAMGMRGTDVAKQAAAIVLTDDRFLTIGAAVEEGRVVFDNIRKFVFYLFSCNLAEVTVLFGASLVGAPIPLLPLQILWLNLVTDTFPALALAMEPAEPGIMKRSPRDPERAILSTTFLRSMLFYAALITGSTLAAFFLALRSGDAGRATTMAFMTLALAQLFHLGNARSRTPVLTPARALANPWAVAAVPLVVGLQFAAVHFQPLADVLRTSPLDLRDWLVVLGLSIVPAVVGQVSRLVRLWAENTPHA